ncbi:hypothetical protein SCLCIDRAFT_1221222 [Scleroderma citrinum Foug A]|uniref:Uncharacterized protein n=1 Tax=Scleroderma citrinum Foug A TaxID=1036808 RepID=A0A0C2Z0N0_9AGAM|nr:hypothetical protein SCLCIDRAFT_1221222 [Scleroderma citrinum Foug A]
MDKPDTCNQTSRANVRVANNTRDHSFLASLCLSKPVVVPKEITKPKTVQVEDHIYNSFVPRLGGDVIWHWHFVSFDLQS